MPDRITERTARLALSLAKCQAFLKNAKKNDPMRVAVEKRVAAYETSLQNLKSTGREETSTAPTGASIGVPVAKLAVKKGK